MWIHPWGTNSFLGMDHSLRRDLSFDIDPCLGTISFLGIPHPWGWTILWAWTIPWAGTILRAGTILQAETHP